MIYVIRHGRTRLNADERLRGRLDVPLDDVGVGQAEALGMLFAAVPLTFIASSPLVRARATAEPIARATDVAVSLDDAFIDRDWGVCAGVSAYECLERFGNFDAVPGIESVSALRARVVDATRQVTASNGDRPAAIVAHDAVNRVLLAALAANTSDVPEEIPQRCGCWNRIDVAGDSFVATVVDAVPGDGRVS